MTYYRGALARPASTVSYATAGMGAAEWTPGPGEIPADDPRIVRRAATVQSTYSPRNIGSEQTTKVADMVLEEAKRQFPNDRVRKLGPTGWTSSKHPAGAGEVGYEVVLTEARRAGVIKRRNYNVGQKVSKKLGSDGDLYNARTFFNNADLSMPQPESPPEEKEAAKEPAPPKETPKAAPWFQQDVGGVPVWVMGLLGAGTIGGLGWYLARRRRKKAPVAPNRRRRRKR